MKLEKITLDDVLITVKRLPKYTSTAIYRKYTPSELDFRSGFFSFEFLNEKDKPSSCFQGFGGITFFKPEEAKLFESLIKEFIKNSSKNSEKILSLLYYSGEYNSPIVGLSSPTAPLTLFLIDKFCEVLGYDRSYSLEKEIKSIKSKINSYTESITRLKNKLKLVKENYEEFY